MIYLTYLSFEKLGTENHKSTMLFTYPAGAEDPSLILQGPRTPPLSCRGRRPLPYTAGARTILRGTRTPPPPSYILRGPRTPPLYCGCPRSLPPHLFCGGPDPSPSLILRGPGPLPRSLILQRPRTPPPFHILRGPRTPILSCGGPRPLPPPYLRSEGYSKLLLLFEKILFYF